MANLGNTEKIDANRVNIAATSISAQDLKRYADNSETNTIPSTSIIFSAPQVADNTDTGYYSLLISDADGKIADFTLANATEAPLSVISDEPTSTSHACTGKKTLSLSYNGTYLSIDKTKSLTINYDAIKRKIFDDLGISVLAGKPSGGLTGSTGKLYFYDKNYYYADNNDGNILKPLGEYVRGAEYVPEVTYTITFNTNGGGNINTITKVTKIPENIDTVIPLRKGYDFVGWYINESLDTQAVPGQSIESDITLYAKWNETSYGNIPLSIVGTQGLVYNSYPQYLVASYILSDNTIEFNKICMQVTNSELSADKQNIESSGWLELTSIQRIPSFATGIEPGKYYVHLAATASGYQQLYTYIEVDIDRATLSETDFKITGRTLSSTADEPVAILTLDKSKVSESEIKYKIYE